jgi:hypothetical protein
MPDQITFEVRVERHSAGCTVSVFDQSGDQYAVATGPHVDMALRMALPYMAYAAEPDPFAHLLPASEGKR